MIFIKKSKKSKKDFVNHIKSLIKKLLVKRLLKIIRTIIIILFFLSLIGAVFLAIIKSSSGLELSEVMYNPVGADNNGEYVEFLLDKTDFIQNITEDNNQNSVQNNISNIFNLIRFNDNDSGDSVELIKKIGNGSIRYWLFTEEGFNYDVINETLLDETNISCYLFSLGATIGNNLDNDGDTIMLWYNQTLLINKSYKSIGCSNGLGCSLSSINFSESNNSSFINTNTSPCLPNHINNYINTSINITTYEENNNETENTSNNINGNISENMSEETNNTNENISENINNNTSTDNIDENKIQNCFFNLSIWSDKEITNNGEPIKYKPIININKTNNTNEDYELSLTYWWEDYYGRSIKNKIITTNTNIKQYTPRIKEKEKILIIKMKLKLNCSDMIGYAEKIIGVIGDGKIITNSNSESDTVMNNKKSSGSSLIGLKEKKYEVLSANTPLQGIINQTIIINITLYNDAYLDQMFFVWAYLYKGNKCYSGDRKKNMKEIMISPLEEKKIILPINIIVKDLGEYNIKIKAVKEGRKTPYELTRQINIIKESKKLISDKNNNKNTDNNNQSIKISDKLNNGLNNENSENINNKNFEKNIKTNSIITGDSINKINKISNIKTSSGSWIKNNGSWLAIILAIILWVASETISKKGRKKKIIKKRKKSEYY